MLGYETAGAGGEGRNLRHGWDLHQARQQDGQDAGGHGRGRCCHCCSQGNYNNKVTHKAPCPTVLLIFTLLYHDHYHALTLAAPYQISWILPSLLSKAAP